MLKTEIEGYNISGLTVTGSTYGQVQYGNSTDYSSSIAKQVVDAWLSSVIKSGDIATARLITYDELMDNLGYNRATFYASYYQVNPEYTPSWVYSSNYYYWTMSRYQDSSSVWDVYQNGILLGNLGSMGESNEACIRPVLELNKSADITIVNS